MTSSRTVEEVAREAFFGYVLPEIKSRLSEVQDRILVSITSSVAYGVADKYSDLDMFIIFEKHEDYLKYHKDLEGVINSIRFPPEYENICDKGVRFELESLRRSDVSKIYYRPRNDLYLLTQTDWLLYWFFNSITVYDPKGVKARMQRKFSSFPPHVLEYKRNAARLRILKYRYEIGRDVERRRPAYIILAKLFKSFNKILDLIYWEDSRYPPHPKWKYYLAPAGGGDGDGPDARARMQSILTRIRELSRDPRAFQAELAKLTGPLAGENGAEEYDEEAEEYLVSNAVTLVAGERRVFLLRDYFIDGVKFRRLRRAVESGREVYLPDELGVFHLLARQYNYDTAMRVSDKLRFLLAEFDAATPRVPRFKIFERRAIERKRWLYLSFVIWRKIRVVEKAAKRGQLFNQMWYAAQVVEHLLEALARLNGRFLPTDDFVNDDFISAVSRGPARLHEGLKRIALSEDFYGLAGGDVARFTKTCWDILGMIQGELVSRNILSRDCVEKPLDVQFEIEYWKYENLFL